MSAHESTSPSRRQSIFTILGWFGFLFLLPLLLKSIGNAGLADFLSQNLGIWGSAGFLLIYFYVFPLLDLIFGSDRHFMPLLTGIVISFLFFAVVVPLPFMEWFSRLFAALPLIKCSLAFLIFGMFAMLLGILLSYIRRGIGLLSQLALILGLPLAACVAAILLHAEKVWQLPLFGL
jgi:hypothetical protein